MVLERLFVTRDMPEPFKFPSLDKGRKRFLWAHREDGLVPHPVVGHVLQVGDVEKFPPKLDLESLDPFLRVCKQGQCLTAIQKNGGGKRLVQLDLACEADGVASQSGIAFIPEAILMRISAEKVRPCTELRPCT